METFNIFIPVTGTVSVSVTADSLEDAIEVLLDQKESLERCPNGKLNLELDKVIVIPEEPKNFS